MQRAPVTILLLVMAAPVLAQPAVGPASEEAAPPSVPAPIPFLVSEPTDLFQQGVELAESGAVEQAKTVFKALTLAYPRLPEPYINLAVLLAAGGDAESAAASAEAGMLAHPVCRAVFQMELVRELGDYSAGLLEVAGPRAPRVDSEAAVAAITALVTAWANAWSNQDADTYLGFYAPTFRPSGDADRERWESRRRARVTAPGVIEVAISDLEVELVAPNRGRATFTQRYRSDSYRDVVTKVLDLEKVEGAWKIVAETSRG